MVLGEVEFRQVAQHVSNLVGCDAVRLFVGCAEPELRHPLVKTLAKTGYQAVGSVGTVNASALLQHASVQALCDLALQSGQVQYAEHWQRYTEDIGTQSVLVAPLERPAGVLGFLLLTDHSANAFGPGECLLLRHYAPVVAQMVEADLYRQRDASSMEETELLQASDQLWMQQRERELEQLKNEFISLVSHELRNPLSAIKGYAVLLRAYGITEQLNVHSDEQGAVALESVLGPQRQREYLDHIVEQTRHLEVLINDLLDISRLHAGHLLLRYQEVDVAALCRRVVHVIQAKYEPSSTQHYEIACSLAPTMPTVWADPDRLQQVLTNILDNAMKYSPQGGLIEVIGETKPVMGETLAQTIQAVSITVRDRGIGIAQEQHNHLFKPFKRLEHALTNEIPGVGLGLYITRKLIEAMDGRITLHSREGEGTTVTFTLPCTAEKLPGDATANFSKQIALTPM